MESIISIYRIKNSGKKHVEDLVQTLTERFEDSLETLDEAGVKIESIFIKNDRLYTYKLVRNIEEMRKIQKSSNKAIHSIIRPIVQEYLEFEEEIIAEINFIVSSL
ncbi:MAG: DUF6176 family protein [Bacteriovoracaceae bacterium]